MPFPSAFFGTRGGPALEERRPTFGFSAAARHSREFDCVLAVLGGRQVNIDRLIKSPRECDTQRKLNSIRAGVVGEVKNP